MKPSRVLAGLIASVLIAGVYGTIALRGSYLDKAGDIWGDEATYFMMTESLVHDRDLAYRRQDLTRTLNELGPNGANGVFLKVGQDVSGLRFETRMPFLKIDGVDDPEANSRLFFGKAFIYPLCVAPFVAVFGTNGFLVFNTLLLITLFLVAYLFVSARSPVVVALLFATAFVFATVVPAYWAWMTPELFNCTLGALAYFCWLYKLVAPTPSRPVTAWLRGRSSDVVAGVLIGIATYSKVTNVLWLLPIAAWWLWRREWTRFGSAVAPCVLLTVGLFAANVAITGDWNYQGGKRKTFDAADGFPFTQRAVSGQQVLLNFDTATPKGEKSRSESRTDAVFDRQVFWRYLSANLEYFAIGRYSGLVPYFFPAVFAVVLLFVAARRSAPWQWFILVGALIEVMAAIVSQPYTYIGSGGSVGNRYFISNYGVWLFLLPPFASRWLAVVPAIVGGLFVAPIVLRPFDSSLHPYLAASSGPVRMFPVELTNINDLPPMTLQAYTKRDFNRDDLAGNPRFFQIYWFDFNLGWQEKETTDSPWSMWVKGKSRADFLLKVDPPIRQFVLELSAGPVATTATVKICGTTQQVTLAPQQRQQIVIDLCEGFPYRFDLDASQPSHMMWFVSVSSSDGFLPRTYRPSSDDLRFLGVRVTPSIIR